MKTLTLRLLSLGGQESRTITTKAVTVTTSEGEISIYADHMPFVTDVVPGVIHTFDEHHKKSEHLHNGGILVTEGTTVTFFQTPQVVDYVSPTIGEALSEAEIKNQLRGEFMNKLGEKEGISSN